MKDCKHNWRQLIDDMEWFYCINCLAQAQMMGDIYDIYYRKERLVSKEVGK